MADKKTFLPNVRFAAGFLDKKYRKYAELGEVIMDKITGEILVKRKSDGRLISFVQNDKYLHDIMIELRILTKNNPVFIYPTDDESWFLSADFNIADIMNKYISPDVLMETPKIEFSSSSLDERNKFEFYLSKESNGFFIRPISRDTDKNLIEYMANVYNIIFQNYSGINEDYLKERNKLRSSDYRYNNAIVNYIYTVTGVSKGEKLVRGYSGSKNIKANHETFIRIPIIYRSQFDSVESVKISIISIEFPKFNKVIQYMNDELNDFDKSMYEKLIAPDNQIVIEHVNIMEFVDNGDQIPANPSISLIALVDANSTLEYIGRIDKLANSAGYIPMAKRPSGKLWTTNNVWAEIIREIRVGGEEVETDHVTDMADLEKFIFVTSGVRTKFTLDSTELNNIYFEVISEILPEEVTL